MISLQTSPLTFVPATDYLLIETALVFQHHAYICGMGAGMGIDKMLSHL